MLLVLDRVLRIFYYFIVTVSVLAVIAMGAALFLSDGPLDVNILQSPISLESFEAATGISDIKLSETDRIQIDRVSFTTADPSILWFMVAFITLGVGLFLYGFHVLRAMVSSAVANAPFTEANVSRLRTLALVALGFAVLESAAPLVASGLAALKLVGSAFRAEFSFRVEPTTFLIVLILFALSEVFARGVALQEENDLTV